MTSLPRPRAGLRRHRVEDQVLVYESRTDRTHLLDVTTGTVLDLLEEGGRTSDALVTDLSRRIGRPADSALVMLAIDELRKADLIDEHVAAAPLNDVSRRELLRRAGLAGAAALLVPTIISLTPNPMYGQTPTPCSQDTGRPANCACTLDSQCASNTVKGGGCNTGKNQCK